MFLLIAVNITESVFKNAIKVYLDPLHGYHVNGVFRFSWEISKYAIRTHMGLLHCFQMHKLFI